VAKPLNKKTKLYKLNRVSKVSHPEWRSHSYQIKAVGFWSFKKTSSYNKCLSHPRSGFLM
jgi:hypothetical protein